MPCEAPVTKAMCPDRDIGFSRGGEYIQSCGMGIIPKAFSRAGVVPRLLKSLPRRASAKGAKKKIWPDIVRSCFARRLCVRAADRSDQEGRRGDAGVGCRCG